MAKADQEDIIMSRQYANEQDSNDATVDLFVMLIKLLGKGGEEEELVI